MDQHSLENHNREAAPVAGGYSACRRLGRGGSAEVWLVSQDSTGVKFALKCFGRPPGGGDPGGGEPGSSEPGSSEPGSSEPGSGFMAREEEVRRELLVISVLDHEHLVKAHGVVSVDQPGRTDVPGRTDEPGRGGFGLLMDYAAGGSLQQLVTARGALSVGETVTVLTPIAQVLGYLHGKGFTHSDVAPGNVLFTAHGKPLLADLGVARMVGDFSGVPDWRTDGFADPAPVDAVRAGLQPERDVYAAAALGWYCLTGQPPPPSAARPPLSLLVPDVPAELAAALEAGLSDDRRRRPAAAELATAVYRSATALPVDLSRSVHHSVLPELLTRRPVPPPGGRLRKRLLAWGRRLKSTGWVAALGRPAPGGFPRAALAEPAAAPPSGAVRNTGDSRRVRHAAVGHAAARDTAVGRTVRHTAASRPPRHSAGSTADGALPMRSRWAAATGAAASRRLAVTGVLTAAVLAGAGLLGLPGVAHESGHSAQDRTSAARESGRAALEAVLPAANPRSPQSAGAQAATLPVVVRRRLASKDPEEAVLGLAQLRSLALREGRLDLLDEVNAPNTPAHAADQRIRAGLEKSGTLLAGFTTGLSGVRRLPGSTAARAVVAVTTSTSAYEERSAGGAVVATGAPQQDVRLRLVLVQAAGRWRIADILPAA
ncbi:protein kinase [Arthrobacter sp. OAP107]|uniref:serine/threonine protein kinase n=1 Tax=Arthrobacter sp. OAP107 TaxID=3156445 RepID=UPI003398CB81